MIVGRSVPGPPRDAVPVVQFRVWQLALFVLLVAVAIANIQDQGCREPALIGIASAGFVGYGVLGWLGWRVGRRLECRVGPMPFLVVYLVAMAALFLAATVIYLVIEYAYHGGRF
jgi:hypothetical protein